MEFSLNGRVNSANSWNLINHWNTSIEVLSLSPLWGEQVMNHQRSVITFQRKHEISWVSFSILNYYVSNLCRSKFEDSLANEEQEKIKASKPQDFPLYEHGGLIWNLPGKGIAERKTQLAKTTWQGICSPWESKSKRLTFSKKLQIHPYANWSGLSERKCSDK